MRGEPGNKAISKQNNAIKLLLKQVNSMDKFVTVYISTSLNH